MRFKVVGGNMANNNVMEIRILPNRGTVAHVSRLPRLVLAKYDSSYAPAQGTALAMLPTIANLVQGIIAYSEGWATQALAAVAVVFKKLRICGNKTSGIYFSHGSQRQPLYSDPSLQIWAGQGVTAEKDGKIVIGSNKDPWSDGIMFTVGDCSSGAQIVQFVSARATNSRGELVRAYTRWMTPATRIGESITKHQCACWDKTSKAKP